MTMSWETVAQKLAKKFGQLIILSQLVVSISLGRVNQFPIGDWGWEKKNIPEKMVKILIFLGYIIMGVLTRWHKYMIYLEGSVI